MIFFLVVVMATDGDFSGFGDWEFVPGDGWSSAADGDDL